MKKLNLILSTAILLGCSSNLSAEGFGIKTNITGTTNYVSRGISQTNDKAAVFGEVIGSYNDFFAGVWASNVDFEGLDGNSEVDLYAGYSHAFGDLTTTLSYLRYLYPDSDDILYYDEAKLELSYPINKLTLGASYALGTYVENDGDKRDYTEVSSSYDFDILNLNLTAGTYEQIGDNYTVGVSKLFTLEKGSLNLKLVYSNYSSDMEDVYKDEENLYASATYSF